MSEIPRSYKCLTPSQPVRLSLELSLSFTQTACCSVLYLQSRLEFAHHCNSTSPKLSTAACTPHPYLSLPPPLLVCDTGRRGDMHLLALLFYCSCAEFPIVSHGYLATCIWEGSLRMSDIHLGLFTQLKFSCTHHGCSCWEGFSLMINRWRLELRVCFAHTTVWSWLLWRLLLSPSVVYIAWIRASFHTT